jgi:hypothetical protein
MKVVWTNNARERLFEIEDYIISQGAPVNAEQLIQRLVDRAKILIEFPNPTSWKTERTFTQDVSETGLRFPTPVKLQISQELALTRLLALGRKKFKPSREFPLQALKALSFFEDAEQDPPVVTPSPLAWDRVRGFFTREVRALTKRYLHSAWLS